MGSLADVKTQNRTFWHDVLRMTLLALLVSLVFFIFQNESVRHELFDLELIRNHLRGENIAGGMASSALLFLVCGGILIGIGMPRIWVSAVAGAVYGPAFGSFLALLAAVFGASVVYKLGETLLSPYVLNRYRGKIESWARRFRENAFWWVLYIRLFPFANASVTGILCGCCKVPFRHYLAGSALGFIPLTVVFAMFGSAGVTGSLSQIILGFGLLLTTVAIRYVISRGKAKVPAE